MRFLLKSSSEQVKYFLHLGSLEPIGLEIQAQAFAFSTNDEINNMTFYNYKLVNRSHNALNDAYFGVHVDPDLGNYQDDYVGCDVAEV